VTDWQEILEPIGWGKVQAASPLLAALIATRMNPFGGRTRPTAAASKDVAKKVRGLASALRQAIEGIEGLTNEDGLAVAKGVLAFRELEAQRSRGANAVSPPDDFSDATALQAFSEAHLGASLLMASLEAYSRRLDRDHQGEGVGRPANRAAREVADAVLMVFVVGRGDIPGLGRKADGSGLSGEFGSTLERVLAGLGIRCKDPLRPAQEALAALEDDRERLNGCLVAHTWVPGEPDPFKLSWQ
jgi:hypothetical protein